MNSKVHVAVDGGVACGAVSYYVTSPYREKITCKLCRKSPAFKRLENWPKKLVAKLKKMGKWP